jgi:gliding motility-associated-like protein
MLQVIPDTAGTHYTYAWNPPFNLDDPYIYNPTATPLVPTVYSVIVYNQFCPGYDTVKVGIDYRSNIFVPSAFTPNNDGKNDVFRVANLSYERVIEFRVFNRWGQEIYNALDNKGWDGTWNGVEMDMGVYNYIIRVVYPDGVEDNFRGTVTLIR